VQGNDLMLSIFKKSQKRNKKASGSEQTVQLVLTIRRAIVVVVLGLYKDSTDHTATSIGAQETQNTSWPCGTRMVSGTGMKKQVIAGVPPRSRLENLFPKPMPPLRVDIHTRLATLSLLSFPILV
jgi:hypothetical protein